MAVDSYAQLELAEESWQSRIARVSNETRDIVSATRELIRISRDCIRDADRALKQ